MKNVLQEISDISQRASSEQKNFFNNKSMTGIPRSSLAIPITIYIACIPNTLCEASPIYIILKQFTIKD